ncbi:MAG: cell division FtsZ family protein [Opitutales bacterium]|nr:cell division FtsZ family protein [Opitutales bacterium]
MDELFTKNPITKSEAIEDQGISLKVIGIGGAGTNMVDRIKLDNLADLHLAVVNTDRKTLAVSPVQERLMIGRKLTRGLSAGGETEIGRMAAEESRDELARMVTGVDLVFLLVGLGGGTGSGAAPVLAQVAREKGAMVITFATLPFHGEGSRRQEQAKDALCALRDVCHAVITLPNDVLIREIGENDTLMEALSKADGWISKGVSSIWSMLFAQGLINVDFGALKNAFHITGGKTLYGLGYGEGYNAVENALKSLDQCPLLHLPENYASQKADVLILNVTGGTDLGMSQVNRILDAVSEKFSSKENTILSAAQDASMTRVIYITVIGVSDLNGNGPARIRKHTPAAVPVIHTEQAEKELRKARKPQRVDQEEFAFPSDRDNRGLFEDTEPNVYDGEDLDIPTFLRRSLKITS